MRRSVAVAALVVLAGPSTLQAAPSQQPGVRRFRDATCGVAFEYPAGWRVEDSPEGECSFVLRPLDYQKRLKAFDVDVYSIELHAGAGSFEEAAVSAGFYRATTGEDLTVTEEKHIGEWFGRGGVLPALAKQNDHGVYRGFECFIAARCHHQGTGYYSGMCDIFTGFTYGNGRWLAASGHDDEIVHSILRSAVLDRPPPD